MHWPSLQCLHLHHLLSWGPRSSPVGAFCVLVATLINLPYVLPHRCSATTHTHKSSIALRSAVMCQCSGLWWAFKSSTLCSKLQTFAFQLVRMSKGAQNTLSYFVRKLKMLNSNRAGPRAHDDASQLRSSCIISTSFRRCWIGDSRLLTSG